MMSEAAKATGMLYRGVWHIPINVCSHCGGEDDPETTAYWPTDKDDHRICPRCAEKEGTEN